MIMKCAIRIMATVVLVLASGSNLFGADLEIHVTLDRAQESIKVTYYWPSPTGGLVEDLQEQPILTSPSPDQVVKELKAKFAAAGAQVELDGFFDLGYILLFEGSPGCICRCVGSTCYCKPPGCD